MATNPLDARELAHQLEPNQVAAVAKLLEVMIHDVDDELSEEDVRAVVASREYLGIPFEEVVGECGFTMGQIGK
jgi:hypothetical protein